MNLAELKKMAGVLGLNVVAESVPAKEPYERALRNHFLAKDYPNGCPYDELQPMLCYNYCDLTRREQDSLWKDKNEWIAQEKLNGVRLIIHFVKGAGVFAHVREVSSKTFRRTELQQHLAFYDFVPTFTAIVDSEAVCGTLQETMALFRTKPEAAREKQKTAPLKLHVFDVMRWAEFDLRVRRLDERLAFIQDFRAAINAAGIGGHFEFPPNHFQDKRAVFERIIKVGGEGIVLKRLSSPYIDATSRSRLGWIKVKRDLEITAYISGFEPGRPGSLNETRVAVLHFSVNTENGQWLAAKVSNLPNDLQKDVTLRDKATRRVGLSPEWLGKVATVTGMEIAYKSGRLVSARIGHWRSDLTKEDCVYSAADLEAVRRGNISISLARIVRGSNTT